MANKTTITLFAVLLLMACNNQSVDPGEENVPGDSTVANSFPPEKKYKIISIAGTIFDPVNPGKSLKEGDEFRKDAQLEFEEKSFAMVIDGKENTFKISKTKNNGIKWEEQVGSIEIEIIPLELYKSITILFPFNSTEKDIDPEVDEYLEELADHIKQTGDKVTLTGHTDRIGSAESNIVLGLARARKIQDLLIAQGVEKDQIEISSKGETQPMATNATESGRHNNRRVEVRLISD